MDQHLAAVLPSRGASFIIKERPTPLPGPNEILIEVEAIALNPIDYIQRKRGFPPIKYPAILGSDIAGIVVAVGSGISSDVPKPGTRVAAYAPSFFMKGAVDYGAFQKRVLVPSENAVPLPENMTVNEASVIPMAAQTAWSGLMQMGITRNMTFTATDKKGILVWGAGSSVGCAVVQIARIIGFTVYATASKKHHAYLEGLGASKMFEYQDKDVVANVVNAGKEDGVTVDMAYLAAGDLMPCIKILRKLKGNVTAKVAMAPFQLTMLWWKLFPNWMSTSVKFVTPPADETERRHFFDFVFRVWLKDKLATGEFVSSPKIRVIGGGLASAENALEEFQVGLSGEKLVIEM